MPTITPEHASDTLANIESDLRSIDRVIRAFSDLVSGDRKYIDGITYEMLSHETEILEQRRKKLKEQHNAYALALGKSLYF